MSETPRPSSKNRRNPERRLTPRAGTGGAIWYVLGFMLLLAIAQAFFYQMQGGETISYSDFKNLVRQDKVQEITLSDERVRGLLKPEAGNDKPKPFSAVRVTDDKLPEELEQH